MQHRELLKASPLFRDLSEAELESIAALAAPQNMVGGDSLFLAGTPADAIYLIEMGTVELRVAGHEAPAARFGNGQVVGAGALAEPEKRLASATAVELTRLVRIPLADLFRLFDATPTLAVKVYRNLARYFMHHVNQMASELKRPYF